MQLNKELRTKIVNYLESNPIVNNEKDKYGKAAKYFNVDREHIRSVWRSIRPSKRGYSEPQLQKDFVSERTQDSNGLSVTINVNTEVKSLEDLLSVCDVDGDVWEVVSWACKKWDLGIKNKAEQIETKALFSVSAKFRPKKVETDLKLQKDILVQELFENAPDFNLLNSYHEFKSASETSEETLERKCLLELCLFDPHFGKLAHAEESGKDEDIKITSAKYKAAIADLISRVNLNSVTRILLPIGNDMINVDGSHNMTVAGTPQACDSRFYKVVRTAKSLLIDIINELVAIAPVDVVVVKGNHDSDTTFLLGEMLDCYYHNTDVVTIFNSPKFRKYYQFGNTGIQFTHGNEEPHQSLGLIFATEEPELWADVKYRYCQVGHFHKNKKISYVSVDEHQGFSVQILPSLSGSDNWHYKKGYYSLRQAKAFLIDYTDGIIGEFTHNCNI